MEKSIEVAYLSLGSNLGNRKELLSSALQSINEKAGTILSVSKVYETKAVGFESSDNFLNICIALETQLDPVELLEQTSLIERQLGRKRDNSGIYSSRSIDIDIIFYGSEVITSESLTIPHPRFKERLFVLLPLNDIAYDLQVPGMETSVSELLANSVLDQEISTTSIELVY